MSGHSKWSTIKRAKGLKDAKRGAIFTKLGNLITVSAKEKGGDIETNFSLRMALDKARQANMPKENIERAIKRGTGELEGAQVEELIYEGIGPVNSQFIVKCLTDNKNRSVATVRYAFTKHGGSLGSVMWNFEKLGLVRISSDELIKYNANLKINANAKNFEYANNDYGDEFELELIELGVDDIKKFKEGIEVIMSVDSLQAIKKYFEDREIKTESADIEYVAKDEIEVSDEKKEKIKKFTDELEENEDVSDFYTNVIM